MELINPTHNAPTLMPPHTKRYTHTRSPSASPTRSYSPLGHDPLLRCLSPTSTLQAFTAASRLSYADSRSPSPRRRTLDATFKNVSEAQKELGSKAAQACLDIRGWTYELEGWEWPGHFKEPEPARKRVRMLIMSIGSLASRQTAETGDEDDHQEYWGCLPAVVVQEHDERLQEISDQLDDIDLEQLKDYTLQAHTGSAESTPRVGHAEAPSDGDEDESSPGDLRQLDDFTTVVTATILQTLPYVNRLARLLDAWSIRIAILKDIPAFLKDLERMRRDLDHGWAAVAVSLRKDGVYASLGSNNMEEMQTLIDASMASLSLRLDRFLDLLEGQDEVVPDVFLDKFEELEERYAEWVVMAQRRVLGDELKEMSSSSTENTPKVSMQRFEDVSRPLMPTNIVTPTFVINPAVERIVEPTTQPSLEDRARTPTLSAMDIQERAKTPTIYMTPDLLNRAITPTIRDAKTLSIISADDTASDHDENKSRLLQEHAALNDTAQPVTMLANNSLTALPQIAITAETDRRPRSSYSAEDHSPTRSGRHVPILLPFEGDESDYQPSLSASSADFQHSQRNTADEPVRPNASTPLPERGTGADSPTDPLLVTDTSPSKKAKTPGNAFTRLFKKDKKNGSESEHTSPTKPSTGSLLRRSLSRKRHNKSVDHTTWGGHPGSQSVDLPRRGPGPEVPRPDTASTVNTQQPVRASVQIDRPVTERGRSIFDDKNTLKLLDPDAESFDTAEQRRPKTAHESSTRASAISQRSVRPTSSPRLPNFPDNWPLAPADELLILPLPTSAIRPDGGQTDVNLRTVSSMAALDSDDFQKFFIDGFPTVLNETEHDPVLDIASAPLSTTELEEMAETATVAKSSAPDAAEDATRSLMERQTSVPTVTSSMLSSDGRQDDLSVARAMSIEGLRQFDGLATKASQDLAKSTLAIPEGVLTDRAVTPDSDSIIHDAEVSYVAAVISTGTPQRSSMHEQPEHADFNAKLSAFPPPPAMPEDKPFDGVNEEDMSRIIKRASMASIKSHLASEVKSIELPAKKRHSTKSEIAHEGHDPLPADAGVVSAKNSLQIDRPSTKSGPTTQLPTDGDNATKERAAAMEVLDSTTILLQRPAFSRNGSRSGAQSPTGSIDTPNFSRLRAGSVDTNENKPPLNATISKRRKAPGLETIKPSGEFVMDEPKKRPPPPADEFDRHVSEVLEKLPAPIRFRARLVDDASSSSSSPRSRTPDLRLGGARAKNVVTSRQASGAGGLTLTPVEASPKKSAAGIKLYHLTQAGRDEPIKLFIRLVGAGDRVMVRVGGGWSDLADFLKQYAEHHGSRTVSGGGLGFELQSADTTPAGSRRASGIPTPGTDRIVIKDDSISSPQEPVSAISGFAELPGSDVEATLLSVNAKLRAQPDRVQSALGTRGSNGNLRKQKDDDATTARKAKWVNTMLEKARKEMSGKARKGESFGDMGRIGSTRRVVFRSADSKK